MSEHKPSNEYRLKSKNGTVYTLLVVTNVGVDDSAKFEISNNAGRYEYLFVSQADTVELALNLLRDAGREDLLVKPRLGDRVGEFVRSREGEVVRITGYAQGHFSDREYATAVDRHGDIRKIFNAPDQTYWVPVEVNVTAAVPAQPERWEVAE